MVIGCLRSLHRWIITYDSSSRRIIPFNGLDSTCTILRVSAVFFIIRHFSSSSSSFLIQLLVFLILDAISYQLLNLYVLVSNVSPLPSSTHTYAHEYKIKIGIDKDECADGKNGGCQHICRNTIGSYVCECNNGFVLHENGHDCKEGSCSYQITSSVAEIVSPNYPEHYPNKKDCTWHFTATPGHRIKLYFNDFDLEPSQDCTYDYIAIYDGLVSNGTTLGRFCGSKVPHMITSSSNKAHMIFKTDSSVQRKGFMARYSTGNMIVLVCALCGNRLIDFFNCANCASFFLL